MDRYSGWPALDLLPNLTANAVIIALRRRFLEKTVPAVLMSDNGAQFTSTKTKHFLKKWGVTHITSSPHFAQSNGTAEACVKQMKKLVRANWNRESGEPEWDALTESMLIYYNTPRYDGTSPSQLLFGHPTRDTLPAHRRVFSKEWQRQSDVLEEKAALVRDKITEHCNARNR